MATRRRVGSVYWAGVCLCVYSRIHETVYVRPFIAMEGNQLLCRQYHTRGTAGTSTVTSCTWHVTLAQWPSSVHAMWYWLVTNGGENRTFHSINYATLYHESSKWAVRPRACLSETCVTHSNWFSTANCACVIAQHDITTIMLRSVASRSAPDTPHNADWFIVRNALNVLFRFWKHSSCQRMHEKSWAAKMRRRVSAFVGSWFVCVLMPPPILLLADHI